MSNQNAKVQNSTGREHWGSKLGFVLAAAGSAVGLGNIWKFPYITGQYGGGAFVLIYLILIAIVGLPVMIAELAVGRTTQKDPYGAINTLKPNSPWRIVGLMALITPFIVLSYYSVVAGWTLGYVVKSSTGVFLQVAPEELSTIFDSFVGNAFEPLFWHGVTMLLTVSIVIAGVKSGIERAAKILMPLLFILLVALMLRSITLEGAQAGIEFFLKPDLNNLTSEGILMALGHSFYTLSLGMGIMITYGSYLSKDANLPSSAVSVTIADTVIAIIAGLAIFPAVFAFGAEPGGGPGLVFMTLPGVFAQMPGGAFFGTLFFILLSIAALTSSMSLLEVLVSYLIDESKVSRTKATIFMGLAVFIFGIPSSLSMGVMSDFTIFGLNFFDAMDYITANILMPLGGLGICLFVGWVLGANRALAEITNGGRISFWWSSIWVVCIKYISPIAIFIVLLHGLEII